MSRAALLLALLLSTGVTAAEIDHSRPAPADWPKLTVTAHMVGMYDLYANCTHPAVQLGCAVIDFKARTCRIYVAEGTGLVVLDHEGGHCDGRDHVGETTLRDAWAAYKAAQ